MPNKSLIESRFATCAQVWRRGKRPESWERWGSPASAGPPPWSLAGVRGAHATGTRLGYVSIRIYYQLSYLKWNCTCVYKWIQFLKSQSIILGGRKERGQREPQILPLHPQTKKHREAWCRTARLPGPGFWLSHRTYCYMPGRKTCWRASTRLDHRWGPAEHATVSPSHKRRFPNEPSATALCPGQSPLQEVWNWNCRRRQGDWVRKQAIDGGSGGRGTRKHKLTGLGIAAKEKKKKLSPSACSSCANKAAFLNRLTAASGK